MLILNPVKEPTSDSRLGVVPTSSGVGKTSLLRELRLSTLLTRFFDLTESSGVFFKMNAFASSHDFSTSPFICLDDTLSISGLLVPSIRKNIAYEHPERVDRIAKILLSSEYRQETQDIKEGKVELDQCRFIPSLIAALIEGEAGAEELKAIRIYSQDLRMLLSSYGFFCTDARGNRALAGPKCLPEHDHLISFAVYVSGKGPYFLVSFKLADDLDPDISNDFSGLLTHPWLKIACVYASSWLYNYRDRPLVPSLIGFEGCCTNVKGGCELQPPLIKKPTTQHLTSFFSGGLKGVGKALEDFDASRYSLLFANEGKIGDDELALKGACSSTVANLIRLDNLLKRFMANAGWAQAGDDDFKQSVQSLAFEVSDYLDWLSQFRIVVKPNECKLPIVWIGDDYRVSVEERTFDPISDILDYEGTAFLETAANLFFWSPKGSSLGEGGIANSTLAAMDANTLSGLISTWVSRGGSDPEARGLLRGVSGGDFVYCLKDGKLSVPLRATHRVGYKYKNVKDLLDPLGRSFPRKTFHNIVDGHIVKLSDDGYVVQSCCRYEPVDPQVIDDWRSLGVSGVIDKMVSISLEGRPNDLPVPVYTISSLPSFFSRVTYLILKLNCEEVLRIARASFSSEQEVLEFKSLMEEADIPPKMVLGGAMDNEDDPLFSQQVGDPLWARGEVGSSVSFVTSPDGESYDREYAFFEMLKVPSALKIFE